MKHNRKGPAAWVRCIGVSARTTGVLLVGILWIGAVTAQNGLCPACAQEQTGQQGTPPRAVSGPIPAESMTIGGVPVSVWRPLAPAPAPWPLVVFSHGFTGSSTQSTFLLQALAGAGYLVVAPDHKDAGRKGRREARPEVPFEDPEDWSDKTYKDRARDIDAVLDAMKRDPVWAQKVDWAKVALMGHSLGGYTVLGMAGAWRSWKRPEVKAVVALSPYCLPLMLNGRLSGIGVPVMYQGGTQDFDITPSVARQFGGAYDLTASPAYFVDFAGADHLAWTDLEPHSHDSIVFYCLAFLDKYLRGSPTADPTVWRQDVADLRVK